MWDRGAQKLGPATKSVKFRNLSPRTSALHFAERGKKSNRAGGVARVLSSHAFWLKSNQTAGKTDRSGAPVANSSYRALSLSRAATSQQTSKRAPGDEKQAKSESLRKISAGIHLLLKNGLGTIFYVD